MTPLDLEVHIDYFRAVQWQKMQNVSAVFSQRADKYIPAWQDDFHRMDDETGIDVVGNSNVTII